MGDFGLLGLLRDNPLTFVLLAVSLIEAIALHEYAHALAADLQGDRMPRAMGRLSFNPIRHLDPLGTLLIFLVGFGWGKPVEFRPSALSSARFGAAGVALAGPMMNLLLAVIGAFALSIVPVDLASCVSRGGALECPGSGYVANTITAFLQIFFTLNILLAVFNLIPLPPLDGSRLLTIFLPPKHHNIIFFLDRYGFLILLAIVFFAGAALLEPIVLFFQRTILDAVGII